MKSNGIIKQMPKNTMAKNIIKNAWNKKVLQQHLSAAKLLDQIKDNAFDFIKNNPKVSEYQVHHFILRQYKEHRLTTDEGRTIVAFDANSSQPHYYPAKQGSKKLRQNTFILIDIWARLNQKGAPYADITWVGFYGKKMPPQIQNAVKLVFKSRDNALRYLRGHLAKGKMPSGYDVDSASSRPIIKAGYGRNIMHTTGHAIGFDSPHGKQAPISQRNFEVLFKNLGYTIEPGIYFEGKFGV